MGVEAMKKYLFVLFLILVFSQTAFALEYTGKLSLSLSEEYDDNIFLTRSDKVDDFITYISPGIGLSLRSQTSQLSLNYIPTFSFYSNNSDLNETSHQFTATGNFALSEKASAELTHTFIKSSETQDFVDIADIGPITRRIEKRLNIFNTNFTYQLTQHIDYTLGIRYSDLDYPEPDLSEVKTYSGNMRIAYRFSESLSFSAGGNFVKYDYRPDSDATMQEYTAGLTYRFNPAYSISITGGPSITKIEDTGETDTGYGGGIALTRTDERGSATLAVRQTIIAGVESGEPLTSREAALRITRELTPRWNITLSGSYNKYESVENDTTDEDVVRLGGSITYSLSPWANLSLNYSFSDHEDNIVDTASYQNNIVLLRIDLSYDKRL
jgi:polysaccharide biosynthesis protein VpsM